LNKVSKKIIGITGAKGALGSQFIKKYKSKVIFRIYKDKIENKKKFKSWLQKNLDIQYFIHLAAISSIDKTNYNPAKTYKINSSAAISIIKILNKTNLKYFKYFLFSSSSHVYKTSLKALSENSIRKPLTVYGNSKKKVEDFIFKNFKKMKFKVGVARIFNFYSYKHGKGFFIQDLKKKMKNKNKILKINKINTFRDYINLEQLCEILYFILNKKVPKVINVGSGKRLNLINLVKLIKNKYNFKNKLIFENKEYPGLFANISLLRQLGYRKKILKFKI
jgi:nucleoside-diphosphate-sugar epimerase